MKTANATKGFDTLKMKEQIQSAIYEETKNMSLDELEVYHQNRIKSTPFWSKFAQKSSASNPLLHPVFLQRKTEYA